MRGNAWFRFYNDVINDPKVQLLPKAVRWAWVELLCLASKNDGVLPPVAEIAFAVRSSVNDAQADVDALILAGLIDITPDGRLTPHNWSARQMPSDTSAARTRKYRKNKEARHSDGPCDVTRDVTVTVQTRPDQRREESNRPTSPEPAREGSEDFSNSSGQGRSVSVEAKRAVCRTLGIGCSEPLIGLYESWPGSRRARDPDALFRKTAPGFYADAPPDVRRACQPLKTVPDPPPTLPPVLASPSLRNTHLVTGGRRRHAQTV